MDSWKKTVLKDCTWVSEQVMSMEGIKVNLSAKYTVRIPQSSNYKPYHEWKSKMQGFTVSEGDYIIKGTIPYEVTPENVLQIVSSHRPNAFEIRIFKDNTDLGYENHYKVVGV